LDPAAEKFQHAKRLRERIYDDNTYFTSSKPPANAPSWTYLEANMYETDMTNEYKTDFNEDFDDDYHNQLLGSY
jgi:hypothetical protein